MSASAAIRVPHARDASRPFRYDPVLLGAVLLLTIGEDAPRIVEELGDLAPVTACGDLRTAVAAARKLARAGDTVLLSPACASYDQFRNFEDRGEQFKALVRELG